MAELVFDCIGARPDKFAVVPSMSLTLKIAETTGQRIDAIALRCQIRIEPARRRYSPAEAERLNDLFGDTERWADTLRADAAHHGVDHGPRLHRQHRDRSADPLQL